MIFCRVIKSFELLRGKENFIENSPVVPELSLFEIEGIFNQFLYKDYYTDNSKK
jgi:hypothetical protein